MRWLLVLASWGCTPYEPFCEMARCADRCIDGIGCVEVRVAEDGVAHTFVAGDGASLCGGATHDSTEMGDGTPCGACHREQPR